MITKKELIQGTVTELTAYIVTTYLDPLNKVRKSSGDSILEATVGIQKQLVDIEKEKSKMGMVFSLSLKEITPAGDINIELITTHVKIREHYDTP